jgi:hypothetical protein
VDSWNTLNNLSVSEALELMNFRSRVAGRNEPFLSQSHIVNIWNATKGVPRDLVSIGHKIIKIVDKEGPYEVTQKIVDSAIKEFLDKSPPRPKE